jgi:hypothetical protein
MSTVVRTFALLAACLLAFLPQAALAEGHNTQSTLGAQGREVTVVECPAGEVLKGFVGRKGAAIDQLQILCAPLLADGTTGSTHPAGDAYGGFGGGPFPANACSPNARIASAHVVLIPDNTMVAGTRLVCVDRAGNVEGTIRFDAPSVFNDGTTIDNTRHGARTDYTCPDESFTGVRIRWDSAVRGLGFLCDTRTPLVAAAPAPAPAKPIKTTGKAKPGSAAASGPPLAPRFSVTGAWKLVANGSEHYNLVLNAQGNGIILGRDDQPFAVVGTLASPDGSPDMAGTFSASMLPTRQLQGGYGQKNGASAQCLLTYMPDGQTIAGDCSRGNDSVRWTATRGEWPAEAAAAPRVDRGALHTVAVKKSVDVYDAPGGNGSRLGELAAGTADVELVQACQDNWCHVRWPGPAHEGWVYSGPDYRSLDQ